MPINPAALSSPDSTQPPAPDTTEQVARQDVETVQQMEAASAAVTDQASHDVPGEPAKKTRRNKAQMIADAVVPADGEMIEVRDVNTGAKIQRTWRDAVSLVATGAVEFSDKAMKYAVLKEEQQRAVGAFENAPGPDPANPYTGTTPAVATENIEQPQPDPNAFQSHNVPPGAKVGDQVRVGAETYNVGHGGVLTGSPVADSAGNVIRPAHLWQRELGTGVNGPWKSTAVTAIGDPRPIFDEKPAAATAEPAPAPEPSVFEQVTRSDMPEGVKVQTERLPHQVEEYGPNAWKISTGILEKIGLPDYSSFQIGPINVTRMVVDDGRRMKVFLGDREVEVPTSIVEGFELSDNTCEFIARRFRGQLKTFLESTGALKQPVS